MASKYKIKILLDILNMLILIYQIKQLLRSKI